MKPDPGTFYMSIIEHQGDVLEIVEVHEDAINRPYVEIRLLGSQQKTRLPLDNRWGNGLQQVTECPVCGRELPAHLRTCKFVYLGEKTETDAEVERALDEVADYAVNSERESKVPSEEPPPTIGSDAPISAKSLSDQIRELARPSEHPDTEMDDPVIAQAVREYEGAVVYMAIDDVLVDLASKVQVVEDAIRYWRGEDIAGWEPHLNASLILNKIAHAIGMGKP